MKELNLEDPTDARVFIKEIIVQLMREKHGKELTEFTLADGSKKQIADIDSWKDSEAVQYAWELLPLFQLEFPEQVQEIHIQ